MQTSVTCRGQTVVPARIRRGYHITRWTKLEWIDDGQTITVVPVASDPIGAVRGMFKDTDLRSALLKSRRKERERA